MIKIACPAPRAAVFAKQPTLASRSILSTAQLQSNTNETNKITQNNSDGSAQTSGVLSASDQKPQRTKTTAQADEDVRRRLEEISGEGGAAGIEYEDGIPQTMKRSVRKNMFRYI
ncbi:uncharacterized protein BJX67DRAFT_366720 [Aspergillus lucknowensis]|uniref:Uncharacterized protein n=1 Tax=Aspergillus lucknowensis TaxID=176173 RepID=A0ABR4LCK5_9EURO